MDPQTKDGTAQEQSDLCVEPNMVQGSVKKAMTAAHAKSRDLWQVEPGLLRVIPNFNARVKDAGYYAHVRTLADSMKTDGFFQDKPLAGYVAKEDGVDVTYIYDGHCRLEAVLMAIVEGAEIPSVPVVVNTQGLSLEDLTVALVRGNSGKPLTPYETAVVCKRLARFGWAVAEISNRLKLSAIYVDSLLLLISAPLEIRKMVMEDVVSATVAIQALKDHGSDAVAVLTKAVEDALGVGKTKATAKHVAPKPGHLFAKAAKKAAPVMYKALAQVQSDPAFDSLSEETRAKILEIIESLGKSDEAASAGELI